MEGRCRRSDRPRRFDLNVVDLRDHPPEQREAEAQKILKDESRFAFDLVNGPVMRATVIQLSGNENILMLNLHHIATDGYSRGALFRDLSVFYDAFTNGHEPSLPGLPVQYADYAVWQRAWLDTGVADNQRVYWERKLAGAPSRLDLPTDHPRPPVRSYLGDHLSMMLDMRGARGSARRRARQRRDACSSRCWRCSRRCCRATPGRTTS